MYQLILGMCDGYERIDIIYDRYFEGSLKTLTRKGCSSGGTLNFDGSSVFQSDSKDEFMKKYSNKNRLYHYWLIDLLDSTQVLYTLLSLLLKGTEFQPSH